MAFRIASTFNDSLSRLTGDEKKAVKTTAFDLQLDPANPGMKFHRIEKARDKNFWSVRVSRDLRMIVHKTGEALLLCYVAHHDDAYRWAQRRKLETHPQTGAAQIVEVRETVQEITVPTYVEPKEPIPQKPPLFADRSDAELLGFGVPEEWLADVKTVDEDGILELSDHLPEEAAEALLELACGGTPAVVAVAGSGETIDPFEHPDAQRRFRVMANVEELEQALEFPWEKWTVFLHPAQRETVEKSHSGPFRVSGTAGTGKTIVALHRAVWLAREHPDARILLTTFSEALAQALRIKLRRLIHSQPTLGERIDVEPIHAAGRRLYTRMLGKTRIADRAFVREALINASSQHEHGFSQRFLMDEWEQVVDAWQLDSWEAYRDVKRLGRRTRLPEARRKELWSLFDFARHDLAEKQTVTEAGLFTQLAKHLVGVKQPPYDFAVIDEAQDVSVAQLRFLAALSRDRPNGLFFAGDLGQRIFQQPYSWASLGVNIRGRSRTLKINYRTSHQIRQKADRLLDPETSDVDGNVEKRTDTVSVFNGPVPEIKVLDSEAEEIEVVANWLKAMIAAGLNPNEIGIFVRSEPQLARAEVAIEQAGQVPYAVTERFDYKAGAINLSPMHLAKGLEFRAVAAMACDDEIIPCQERIAQMGDTADLEDIYNTERHLFYVACTRAREHLLVTSTAPASEFLEDMA